MLAHGGDPDRLSPDDMNEMILMYADGMIGNRNQLMQMASLTAGIFNYIRTPHTPPYSTPQMLGMSMDYFVKPKTDEEKQDELIKFVEGLVMMSGLKVPDRKGIAP